MRLIVCPNVQRIGSRLGSFGKNAAVRDVSLPRLRNQPSQVEGGPFSVLVQGSTIAKFFKPSYLQGLLK
jgi:hypothetical protein